MPPDYRRACTRRIASTNWGTWNESRQASKKRKASNNDAASYHVSLTYTDDNDHEYEDQDTEDDDDDDSEVEEDAEDEPITCRTLKWLSIGDRDSVEEFYRSRFCAMQQTSCRTVAKGWIRIIHPKKQSKNPYIGGNAKRPKWWPDRVLHKEPDHIKKPGNVTH